VHLIHLLKWFMFLQLGQRNNTVASPSLEQSMSDSGQVLQEHKQAYNEITTALKCLKYFQQFRRICKVHIEYNIVNESKGQSQ